jgi:hypothetical protein
MAELLQKIPDVVPKTRHFVSMEKVNKRAYEKYTRLNQASSHQLHQIIVAVKQRNLNELERILHIVSDPNSPRFGQHLSNKEVRDLTALPESTLHVTNYL